MYREDLSLETRSEKEEPEVHKEDIQRRRKKKRAKQKGKETMTEGSSPIKRRCCSASNSGAT
jgi:hypothetical protein